MKAQAHMCAFGMTSKDKQGVGAVLKPTTFMTNSVEAYKALSKRCPGHDRHVHLVEGRAAAAQIYPKELCLTVSHAIINQARIDAEELVSIKCIDTDGERLSEISNIEHEAPDWRQYWDDVSGQVLDPKLTQAARAEEVECIKSMGVYKKVPISQCVSETGRRPVGTRWIDVNKGDSVNPKHRSRLVARN